MLGSQVRLIAIFCGLTAASCRAQTDRPVLSPADALRFAVQSYLRSPEIREYDNTPYRYTFVELASDGTNQAVVYLTGSGWCGTGGCMTLILTPNGPSYTVIGKIPATRLPIRVLTNKSHGWHDLSAWEKWDDLPGYDASIQFEGRCYTKTTLGLPSRRLAGNGGKMILSSNNKEFLVYP